MRTLSVFALLTMAIVAPDSVFAAGAGHDEAHGKQLLMYACINFSIFVGLLWWKARPAAQKFARNRHADITEEISRVETRRAELQTELSAAQARTAQASTDAEQLIADVEAAAKTQAAKMIEAASAQAEGAEKSAQQQILAAEREAQHELLATAAGLLRSATSSKLESDVSSDKDTAYSSENLAQIGA